MNKLAVRLDDRQDYEDLIKNTLILDADIQSIWCIKHLGKSQTNPHYHFAIETKSRSDTFIARFKNLFTKGSGNGHHSRKKWDGKNRYIQYTLKEVKDDIPLESVLVLNITRTITTEWIQWYSDEILAKLLADAQNETAEILDNTPGQVCVKIIRHILAQPTFDASQRTVFDLIFKHYMDKGDWLPNKFQTDRYINYIRYKCFLVKDAESGGTQTQNFIEVKYQEWYFR